MSKELTKKQVNAIAIQFSVSCETVSHVIGSCNVPATTIFKIGTRKASSWPDFLEKIENTASQNTGRKKKKRFKHNAGGLNKRIRQK